MMTGFHGWGRQAIVLEGASAVVLQRFLVTRRAVIMMVRQNNTEFVPIDVCLWKVGVPVGGEVGGPGGGPVGGEVGGPVDGPVGGEDGGAQCRRDGNT